MPALKCPRCGTSDLHAVHVETAEPALGTPHLVELHEKTELACKRCGWTPSIEEKPGRVVDVQPADSNV